MLHIEISGALEKAIAAAVTSGEFESPEEYLRAALKDFRVKKLNEALEEGYRDFENGNIVKVTNIDAFFEKLNQEIEEEQNS
jgi:Arc/MetJ-type ribon-helix-helix transcriptional regulator